MHGNACCFIPSAWYCQCVVIACCNCLEDQCQRCGKGAGASLRESQALTPRCLGFTWVRVPCSLTCCPLSAASTGTTKHRSDAFPAAPHCSVCPRNPELPQRPQGRGALGRGRAASWLQGQREGLAQESPLPSSWSVCWYTFCPGGNAASGHQAGTEETLNPRPVTGLTCPERKT